VSHNPSAVVDNLKTSVLLLYAALCAWYTGARSSTLAANSGCVRVLRQTGRWFGLV